MGGSGWKERGYAFVGVKCMPARAEGELHAAHQVLPTPLRRHSRPPPCTHPRRRSRSSSGCTCRRYMGGTQRRARCSGAGQLPRRANQAPTVGRETAQGWNGCCCGQRADLPCHAQPQRPTTAARHAPKPPRRQSAAPGQPSAVAGRVTPGAAAAAAAGAAARAPVALAQRVQPQLVGDLCRVHGVGQVLLVGKHQQHRVAQLILQCGGRTVHREGGEGRRGAQGGAREVGRRREPLLVRAGAVRRWKRTNGNLARRMNGRLGGQCEATIAAAGR